jgi:predicted deacylase
VPYHDNDQLIEAANQLARSAGARARSSEIGRTCEGRTIVAVRVAAPGRTPSDERPQALLTANMHGNEVISSEVALNILSLLCADEPGPEARALLDLADVVVVPAINLDSRFAASEALAAGRFSAPTRRGNTNRVDLNRNFPRLPRSKDVWHPLAGTRVRFLPWYHGTGPLSEPEARAIFDLASVLKPRAAIGLHSVGRKFLYPYCCSPEAPADLESFLAMGKAFTSAQGSRPYHVCQARSWYTIVGDMDDWMYDELGTLAVTVELSQFFEAAKTHPMRVFSRLWSMNPAVPEPSAQEATQACIAALAEGVRQTEAKREKRSCA